MKIRRLIICFLIIILPQLAYTQRDDFGIWYGINAGFSLNKKLDIGLTTMIRTFNNASKIEQAFIEGEVEYKFNKYISVSGSYRLIDNLEDNSEFHIRHKWFTDIKGTLPLANISLSARFRFQVQTKTYFENEADKIPDYHGRIRLKGIYKIPDFPINPYLCIESFSALFENSDRLIDKNRFTIGFEYKLAKRHSVDAEYVFQRDFLPHLSDINIVAVTYNFKL